MATKERFFKNTLSLMGSQVAIKALSFILSIFLARYLGATNYGKYSFGYAYFALFGPVAGLGLNLLVVREASRKKEETPVFVGTAFVLKLISTVCMVVLAFGILQFIPTSRDAKLVVYLFGLGFILEHLYGSVSMTYSTYERFDIYALMQFIERIFSFGLIITLLFIGQGLLSVAMVRPVSGAAILLIGLWVACRKILKSRLGFNKSLVPFFLKEGWPFIADSLFMIMYLKVDIVMLQAMKSSTEVGLYSIAIGLILVFRPLQMAVLQSAYPIFSRTYADNQDTFSLYFERISRFLLTTGLVIAIAITIAAPSLILLLYGKEFSLSISMLQITAWILPLMSLSSLSRTVLISCNLQKVPMVVGGCNVLVNILLNSFLIPLFGGHGAAVATLITQFTGIIIFLVVVKKKLKHIKVIRGLSVLKFSDLRAIKVLFVKKGKI